MLTKALTLLGFASTSVLAGTTAEWKQRSVYQLLTDRFYGGSGTDITTYQGGTWKGIEDKLDYIQGMGFDAIWISPVVDNTEGGYHGYWAKNWNEINSHFGSEDDLKSLVSAAHAKGIWVMVDVVANHVGPVGNDFSQITPFSDSSDYHSNCDINWGDMNSVRNCRLAGLPDLNQDNPTVRSYLKNWVKGIVETYGFDGIRIDTIPEVSGDFWKEYGAAAGVFQMGECFNGDPAYVGPYQQDLTGLFNYPMYYTIRDVF
jgi:alpha-amylase